VRRRRRFENRRRSRSEEKGDYRRRQG